jgi:hypothetical protein
METVLVLLCVAPPVGTVGTLLARLGIYSNQAQRRETSTKNPQKHTRSASAGI